MIGCISCKCGSQRHRDVGGVRGAELCFEESHQKAGNSRVTPVSQCTWLKLVKWVPPIWEFAGIIRSVLGIPFTGPESSRVYFCWNE